MSESVEHKPVGIVTKISRQTKDVNRVSVYLDSKYVFSLTLDQLLESRLKKGVQILPEQIVQYKNLSADGKLRARALEWVMSRPRAQRELKDYLMRKGASDELIEKVLEEFSTKKYVDDERYAIWLYELRSRKNKSQRAIFLELATKGISQEVVRKLQDNQRSNQPDKDALRALIDKVQYRSRYADEKKLIAYLMGKGFSYSDIKACLKQRQS